ncbi:MAG: STAS domain-containing protein [Spirochaetales bacterium]|nr:STAS domain-containing protein [Spirochaetales bacterium]
MKALIDRKNGTARIELKGELTIEHAREFYTLVKPLFDSKKGQLTKILLLDAGISRIDVAGVQLLLALRKSADTRGISLDTAAVGKNPSVMEEKRLLGLAPDSI